MAHLALALLGPFQATLDGQTASGLKSDYLRALLAYLAVGRGREYTREALAALLWPERPDREALSSLRYALSKLHGALGDRRSPSPYLMVTHTTVQFNPASDHWLDAAEFDSLASRSDLPALERAAALYRGPFLDGLSIADSSAFDEWGLLQGEEYRRSMLAVLERLASLRMARGEYGEVARWARRQLELEPYREQAHRELMLALALRGERSAALAQYEVCRRLLAEELSCEPEDETQALYAQIRDGTLPQRSLAAPSVSVAEHAQAAGAAAPLRFVARERELARLGTLLERALAGRGGVALISGEAGAGKTALLDEFARQASQTHADLIVLRGSCNAHGGAGDPYLPFREILQTLAGDIEGRRAGGTLSVEEARRLWEVLPLVGAALVEQGPDLIDSLVPGEALLQRIEAFPVRSAATRDGRQRAAGQGWQMRLQEMVGSAQESTRSGLAPAPGAAAPQADLFAQVTRVLHTVAASRPLLLATDDLQWADSGSAALLFHLGRRLAGSRILLTCAYRPEVPDAAEGVQAAGSGVWDVMRELCREWGDVLIDLDQADGRAFVEAFVDSEPNRLGKSFRQALYDHTEGNPLFAVELLRSFQREEAIIQDKSGRWVEARTLNWEKWPPQVEAVIASHLAGLPDEERALLQAASVQGEQFAAEVAAQVLGWSEEAAVRRLSGSLTTRHRLVHAVSLDRLASSQRRLSRYRFRHSLVQRSAYHSLDAVERVRLHEATGRALEALYAAEGERPAASPYSAAEVPPYSGAQALAPELARHYEVAGLPLEAARYCLQAGRWAARLVAYDETVAHLERGLSLLEGVAPSPERLHLELALCSALVNPAWLQRGWQSPTFTGALQRLSELTQHPALQDDPQCLAALTVLAQATTLSADPERGRRVGEQLLRKVQDSDRQSLMLAHWALAHSDVWRGQLVTAREHLEGALALYSQEVGHPLSPLLGGDPSVIGSAMLSFTQWLLGYPDQGRAGLRQALVQAQAIAQPSTVALAHMWATFAHLILSRDQVAAQSHAAALRPLGEAGLMYRAWADLLAGQGGTSADTPEPMQDPGHVAEEGSAPKSLGAGVGQVAQLLVQARLCALAGRAEAGLAAMNQAYAWIERTGVRVLEAEVWRMRGELLLQGDRPHKSPRPVRSGDGEAEACFCRALDIAREQQARWLELRAAVGLARLWQAQGRRDEACELLSGIYSWFTEGFDTVDLAEAKALLEELQRGESHHQDTTIAETYGGN